MTLTDKKMQAVEILKQSKRVLVAFSGGIDSTLVLKLAIDTLGAENVLAVVANSDLFTQEEFNHAVELGQELGAKVLTTNIDYLSNYEIKHNTPASWYWMKKLFYIKMNQLSQDNQADVVLDGMIMDDKTDFRPGLRARDEEGAQSILQMANFYKSDVRNLAAQLGLQNWNKVASCSVSSRFAYNTELTMEAIERVMQAEAYLRSLGFMTNRVRVQDLTARIEVPMTEMMVLMQQATFINAQLQALGYKFVTIDLEGFKSGRMNEQLDEKIKQELTK